MLIKSCVIILLQLMKLDANIRGKRLVAISNYNKSIGDFPLSFI